MRLATTIAAGLTVLTLGQARAQAPMPGSAPPGPVTTRLLAEACDATSMDMNGAAALGYCRGFITAAGQYHREISTDRPPIFCLPSPSPTFEAAQASFVAWAKANPQYGSEPAVDGLMRWAAAAYPCPTPPAPAGRTTRR